MQARQPGFGPPEQLATQAATLPAQRAQAKTLPKLKLKAGLTPDPTEPTRREP
jgi:hypothetical protein